MVADMTTVPESWDSRRRSAFPASSFCQPLTSNIDSSTPVRKGTSATSLWTIAALFSIQGHQAVLGSLLPEPRNKSMIIA